MNHVIAGWQSPEIRARAPIRRIALVGQLTGYYVA
jgi:hypothetical protein